MSSPRQLVDGLPAPCADTLADFDFVWCARCLEPFKHPDTTDEMSLPLLVRPPVLHEHHPMAQRTFRQHVRPLFPSNFPLGWTIPVHRECHYPCYSDAEAVDSYLTAALRLRDLAERDDWARRRHDEGLYWHSMIVNADTYRRFGSSFDPPNRALLIERQLSSGSGTTSRIHPVSEKEIRTVVPRTNQTQVLNHLANRRATLGHVRSARRTLAEAERFVDYVPPSAKDSVALSSLYRLGQVTRDSSDTSKAVRIARGLLPETAYSFWTALVLHGWNSLCDELPSAFDPFLQVLTHVPTAPWLYLAEAIFGRACCALMFEERPLEEIYEWLVQAQYIYVILGLQGTPHTNLPERLAVPKDVSCFPGHLLLSDRFRILSNSKRLALRQQAIGVEGDTDWLYQSLVNDLGGRGPGNRGRIVRSHLTLKMARPDEEIAQ